jgi:hypothetical protein
MGYGKAKRLGGLEVHGHLELGRELHREIARLLAAQDAIDISGGATAARKVMQAQPDLYEEYAPRFDRALRGSHHHVRQGMMPPEPLPTSLPADPR